LPDRAELRKRLNDRAAWMFSNGLLEETKKLLDAGYSPELKPLQSVGYKQAVKVLLGEMSTGAAVVECQARTRQYAKRQLTWFRNDSGIEWLAGFGSDVKLQALAIERVERFLAGLPEKL
jgi:tRNA dimethylallyltransferase